MLTQQETELTLDNHTRLIDKQADTIIDNTGDINRIKYAINAMKEEIAEREVRKIIRIGNLELVVAKLAKKITKKKWWQWR